MERLLVLRGGVVVFPLEARQIGEVGEIRGRGRQASLRSVERERVLERAARALDVSERLRDEPEIVVIRGETPSIARPGPELHGAGVEGPGVSEVAAILRDARKIADRVARGAPIATPLGERVAARPVLAGAVQGALAVPPGADVAESRSHPRRIAHAPEAPQAFAPTLHGGVWACAPQGAVTFGSQAVADDFLAPRVGGPGAEALQDPHEERVAPRLGPRVAQAPGGVEIGDGEAFRRSARRKRQEIAERFPRVVGAVPHRVTQGGCHDRGLGERPQPLRGRRLRLIRGGRDQ